MGRFSFLRSRRGIVLTVLGTAVLVLVAVAPSQAAEAYPPGHIFYSSSAGLTNPQLVRGATFTKGDQVYVIARAKRPLTKVTFWIDNAGRDRSKATAVDASAPYVYILRTGALSAGGHRVDVFLEYADGDTAYYGSKFAIGSGGSATDPGSGTVPNDTTTTTTKVPSSSTTTSTTKVPGTTTTPPTTTKPPTTTPAPASASACLQRSTITKVSSSSSQINPSPADNSTLDARGATISMNDGWLVTPSGGNNVCWLGGVLQLTINDQSAASSPTDAWASIWHHDGGFTTKSNSTNWVYDGVTVKHVGDAFNISDGSKFFEIRNSHITDIRDDCVQNDRFYGANVHDNFFDGCYVGFSARASGVINDGSANTWTINNNLIWIKPMWSVYKSDSPGNGEIIKWDTANLDKTPHLVFKNNVVRVGKSPFQSGSSVGQFYFPPDIDFSGNTLIWDGAGSPPSSLTNMFNAAHNSRITTMAEWDGAVAKWKAAHPEVK